ncbi:hypothetical protein BT96DRAFT_948403 [Gymnopus androsaceus JB14]|uniref:NAD-specific glutamate dehydrogenase second domain-containing protein n=1 Tax=Gymnopus androsaceus JB14 TaxID=1447944 RepID=A0A6A4GNN5_9AGAR|nr:hypothetical protein BT96DRAFT_948403 [Gymnopus androsaceus JB14]
MWSVEQRYGPVMEVFEVEGSRERRLVIGYKMGGTTAFFSALSNLYHFYSLYSARKYIEKFFNGVTIISLYLNPVPNSNAPPIEHSILQVRKEASLLYFLPENPFFFPKAPGTHAVQEVTLRLDLCTTLLQQARPGLLAAQKRLGREQPAHAEAYNNIKRRFREETFTRESIEQVIHTHSELIRLLYVNFAMVHYPASNDATEFMPTLSYQRLQTIQPLSDEELYDKIRHSPQQTHPPSSRILPNLQQTYPQNQLLPTYKGRLVLPLGSRVFTRGPVSMFSVIRNEFRGFHIRFRDVARGWIRIVMSRNKEMLFDENYNLASTQSLKNKDISEGGAKGTILPSIGATPRLCFEKYVDAIVDLLIPGKTPGIKETLVDLYEKPELLFFGPDEGTADMMDWAALDEHNVYRIIPGRATDEDNPPVPDARRRMMPVVGDTPASEDTSASDPPPPTATPLPLAASDPPQAPPPTVISIPTVASKPSETSAVSIPSSLPEIIEVDDEDEDEDMDEWETPEDDPADIFDYEDEPTLERNNFGDISFDMDNDSEPSFDDATLEETLIMIRGYDDNDM